MSPYTPLPFHSLDHGVWRDRFEYCIETISPQPPQPIYPSSVTSFTRCFSAVQTVHSRKIVHCDLKPANFLLVRGKLKLIDFGISKTIQNDTTNVVRENQVGTVNYMSPEALRESANTSTAKGRIKVDLGMLTL